MINVIGTGMILVLIGGIGYISWTRPKRPYEQKDYSLATIRVSQAAIVVRVALRAREGTIREIWFLLG